MALKIVIALSLVLAAILASGCCSCCLPTDPGSPSNPGSNYSGPGNNPAIDGDLVGAWGDSGTMGNIVDSAGNFVGDAYAGQAYRFNSDGTYLYRIIGSGIAIKGLAEVKGNYRVSGDKLYLYNKKENFYPSAGEKTAPSRNVPGNDETFVYWFEDGAATLALMDEASEYTERFHRSE